MIYITQLIYLKPGQEDIFDEFEAYAIPLIENYNGRLLLRIRPDSSAYLVHSIGKPYEIHFIQFSSESDFYAFMNNDERKKFLHLKNKSISESFLVKGQKI